MGIKQGANRYSGPTGRCRLGPDSGATAFHERGHRIFLSVGIQLQTNLFCRNGNPIQLADYPLDPNVIDFEDAHHDLAHKGSNSIL